MISSSDLDGSAAKDDEDKENCASCSPSTDLDSRSGLDKGHRTPANIVQNKCIPFSDTISLSAVDVRKILQKTKLNVDHVEANFSVKLDMNISVSGEAPDCINAIQFINEHLKLQSRRDTNNDKSKEYKRTMEKERPVDWSNLPALLKNFYVEAPEVAELSEQEVALMRTENNTTVQRLFVKEGTNPDPIPNPVLKIEHCFARYPELMKEIVQEGLEKPSSFQSQTWPILLSGEDMIGIMQTNVGKTLAFLLPALVHIENQTLSKLEREGPCCLILTLTRDLALQLEKEIAKYSFLGTRTVCLCGGENRRQQINLLKQKTDIIIASPGRLKDLVNAKKLTLKYISFVVLYELDFYKNMFDQISEILLNVRQDRQTVMTAEVWRPEFELLAQTYMRNPIQLCVSSVYNVRHVVEMVDEEEKTLRIENFIKTMDPKEKPIIFCHSNQRAEDLCRTFSSAGIKCIFNEGSQIQIDKDQVLGNISSDEDELKLFIATDVGSCGLNLENISYIVNFDFPRNIENYVDRIDRILAPARRGTVLSYFTSTDCNLAKKLIKKLKEFKQSVPDQLQNLRTKRTHREFIGNKIFDRKDATFDIMSQSPIYKEAPEVASLSLEEVTRIRKEGRISVDRSSVKNDVLPAPIPNPVWTFEQCFAEFPDLIEKMHKQGLNKPSPMQSQAWPVLLRGEDMIGIAPTSDDKILACILPAIIHAQCQPTPRSERDGPCVLVLTQTWEEAFQLKAEINKYSLDGMRVASLWVDGRQKNEVIEQKADIITAVPGRVIDLLKAKNLNTKYISFVILYEFDSILDKNFRLQICTILTNIRPNRQTVITSSTRNPGFLFWAKKFVKNPIHVYVDFINLPTVGWVKFVVKVIEEKEKWIKVREFIATMKPDEKAIIFCRLQKTANKLCAELYAEGVMCQFAGDLKKKLNPVQANTKIFITTTPTFYNFNFMDIAYVLNFDFPRKMGDYVQRIELIKQDGTYISFINITDCRSADDLIKYIQGVDQEVPSELLDMRRGFQDMEENETFKSIAASLREKYPPVVKQLYKEDPEVINLSEEEVAQVRKDNRITVGRITRENSETSDPFPKPVWKFEQCFADFPDLVNEMLRQGLDKPSFFQSQAWPVLLSGEDMIGMSHTETCDKTLAFLLPALVHIESQPMPRSERKGPSILVLAPTNESAMHLEKEVKKFSFRRLTTVCAMHKRQLLDVRQGTDILIVTLRTLRFLEQQENIITDYITYIVLYEVDQMWDIVAEKQIFKLLLSLQPDRQTVMTTMNWSPRVNQWAQCLMKNPIKVCVDLPSTVGDIRQSVEIIKEGDEIKLNIKNLCDTINPNDKVIIICRKKRRANELFLYLNQEGLSCQYYFELRPKHDGMKILIVRSDTALMKNIKDFRYVINIDFPRKLGEYIQRLNCISQTGCPYNCITYLNVSNWKFAESLSKSSIETEQDVPDELKEIVRSFQQTLKECIDKFKSTSVIKQ